MSPKSRSRKADYDYASAKKAGLGPVEGHWPSRVPSGADEGLILKLPGHPTLDKTLRGEQEAGYGIIQRGSRLYSYERSDPRLRAGSVSAPRSRMPSGAMPTKPEKRKRGT